MKKIIFASLLLITINSINAQTQLNSIGSYLWNDADQPKIFNNKLQLSFVKGENGFPSFGSVLAGGGYYVGQDGGAFQLFFPYSETYGGVAPKIRLGRYDNQGWTNWETFYTSANANKSNIDWSAKILTVDDRIGVGTSNISNPITVQKVSGGTGFSGSDGNGGIRVRWSTGYGVALDAWDGNSPKWGITKYVQNTPTVMIEGVYNTNDVIFNSGGYVGIGTVSPKYKLDVIGTIRAREIKVDLNGADFVFENTYKLMPLNELEKFVKEQKHLPEIAPAKEMENNGTDLGVLTSKLLQKIEELTLYTIEQNKKIEEQNQEFKILKAKIKKLESNKR